MAKENQAKFDQLIIQNNQLNESAIKLESKIKSMEFELDQVNEENKDKDIEIEKLRNEYYFLHNKDLRELFNMKVENSLTFSPDSKIELDYIKQ